MNTLHLCHWQDRKHFTKQSQLLGEHDSLVIYGTLTTSDKSWIQHNMSLSSHPWYLVNNQMQPNIRNHEINNDQWLTLIIEHKNTLTWQ
jgi:hypothetical protein